MEFWVVYWDKAKNQYQLRKAFTLTNANDIGMFKNFDMAYDYVTKANKMNDVMAYSRWAR